MRHTFITNKYEKEKHKDSTLEKKSREK